jgi:hypothetical protein
MVRSARKLGDTVTLSLSYQLLGLIQGVDSEPTDLDPSSQNIGFGTPEQAPSTPPERGGHPSFRISCRMRNAILNDNKKV